MTGWVYYCVICDQIYWTDAKKKTYHEPYLWLGKL